MVTVRPRPHEHRARICEAIARLFPDYIAAENAGKSFPITSDFDDLVHHPKDMDFFFERIQQQRILDTAMDLMALKSDGRSTSFRLSLAAAEAGKVSFVLPDDPIPPGNVMTVVVEGPGLDKWIEDQTWHEGRRRYPRYIGDERE